MNFFVLLFLCFTLTGCSGKKEHRQNEKVLRINFQDGALPSIHPHLGIDYRIRSLQSALFEGLTRMDEKGVPQPSLAEKITISDDKTKYTFYLRSSKWSNGEPVTAFQFEKAWKMAIAKTSSCVRPDLFYIIKNAKKVKKGEISVDEAGINAINTNTLEVILEHPAPYFLELISNSIFAPFSNSCEPTIFNGPFIVDKWKKDEYIFLKKNPFYWAANTVSLEKIEILFITDAHTALQLFEKKELDWIGDPFSPLPLEMLSALENKENLKTKEVARIYWLYCNTQVFPFNNPAIRKALSLSINRNEIIEHILLSQIAASTPLPNNLTLLKRDYQHLCSFDPMQARFLLNDELKELGITIDNFPPIVLSYSHISGQKQLAEALQSDWQKNLGIKVSLSGAEWNLFFDDLSKGKFQIGGCIKSALFRDPIYHLELLEDKSHSYNVSRWEDSAYQDLLKQARLSIDAIQREYLLRKAETILYEQAPVIPVYSEVYTFLTQPFVKGIVIQDLGHVDFRWIEITKE